MHEIHCRLRDLQLRMLGCQYELQLRRIGIDHILLNGQTGLGRLSTTVAVKSLRITGPYRAYTL